MNTQANQTATRKPALFRVESNIIHDILLSIGIPPKPARIYVFGGSNADDLAESFVSSIRHKRIVY